MYRLGAILAGICSMAASLACCCPAALNRPIVVQPPAQPIAVQQPPVKKEPAAPQPKKPPAVAGAPRTFNLIPIIDLQWDIVDGQGKWQKQGKELKCVEGNFVPRVQVPYSPPEEYDFVVTFSQPELRNGVSLIVPKPDGGMFYWAVGFNNGNGYGFDSDRGANLQNLIQVNQQFTTTVQIRKTGVTTLVNGKTLIQNQDVRALNVDDWRRMKNDRILGVACDDPCTFHRIQIVEITGNGKASR